jgi:hypothetical protein
VLGGDYAGIYAWLDTYHAKECGDSLAALTYTYNVNLIDELKAELGTNVTIDKNTRIYVIYRERDTNKNKGNFIFGNRKAAAWTGYSPSSSGLVDEED